jgi:hypothetical protein
VCGAVRDDYVFSLIGGCLCLARERYLNARKHANGPGKLLKYQPVNDNQEVAAVQAHLLLSMLLLLPAASIGALLLCSCSPWHCMCHLYSCRSRLSFAFSLPRCAASVRVCTTDLHDLLLIPAYQPRFA